MPASGWTYNTDGTAISLLPAGTRFVANDIYEFSYSAKDPTVNGIGFAAVRDFNAFLRYEKQDDAGTPNPLAGDVTRIYTEVSSQPGRMLNDFRNLGFNQAENGRIVFDGMMQWIAAGDGINMNLRFSQPGRTQRNRQDQLYLEGVFPFANQQTTDPISGRTAGRYDACTRTGTCPLAMEIYSANEYWVKGASLLHTDPAGTRRSAGSPAGAPLSDLQPPARRPGQPEHHRATASSVGNPLDAAPIQRALWEALDQWSTRNIAPPPSMVPRLADGTLVAALPREGVGFPSIPGVTYTGLKSTRYRLDYGAEFYRTGIMTINPPVVSRPLFDNPKNGPIYPTYVPRTDADGNDLAGVRLPAVDRAARHLHGLGAARRRASQRRLRRRRADGAVRQDQGRAHGVGGSAAVDRRAVCVGRGLRRRGHAGNRAPWSRSGWCLRRMRRRCAGPRWRQRRQLVCRALLRRRTRGAGSERRGDIARETAARRGRADLARWLLTGRRDMARDRRMPDLAGQVAVVTGGTFGVGRG